MAITSPFDLNQLRSATEKASPPSEPTFVPASDELELAVRVYTPSDARPQAIVVFYHGGGAHSAAGYQLLANGLATEYNIKVYTPNIRGHGQSEGSRGDAPSPEQLSRDVDTVLDFVRKENEPEIPLFCAGHSSGAGLMIQYATTHKSNQQEGLSGYLLVSPQLGPNAKVERESSPGFCKVSILPFILNGIFGVMGHYPAVQFQYSEKEIDEAGVVGFNTVNMANAISPTQPRQQLEAMESSTNIHLWMGQEDELFDSEKVKALYPLTTIVADGTHLGILVQAHQLVGPWIVEQLEKTTSH